MNRLYLKDRPLVMGILNVTPDSFSDGGAYFSTDKAVARGRELVALGADIIDVGGESTRPGSPGVSAEQELERVIPVIAALARDAGARLSIDTTKATVAAAAVDAGAGMINDVSTLRNDGAAIVELAARTDVELLIMHSRKRPADMQEGISYADVVVDVRDELAAAAARATAAGVDRRKVWLDPGIGFAKTAEHNLELLARLPELVALGYPVLVGPSRKQFIGAVTGAPVDDRLGGTAAAVAAAVLGGASAVRVHDVALMRQAAWIAHGIRAAGEGADA